MTYLQRSNYGRRRRIVIPILIVAIMLSVIWGLHRARSSMVSGALYYVAFPLWKTEDFLIGRFNASLSLFRSKRALEEENTVLKDKVTAALLSSLSAESYKKENEELKAALHRLGDDSSNYILAYVLAGPPRTLYDTFIVDVGSDNGVSVGMKVIALNIALGEVIETASRVSKVRLYSSPEAATEVVVGSNGSRLLAKGKGGGNFLIEVPKGIGVEKNDPVRLPGGAVTLLGMIGHIESKAADPFDKVYVASPINVFEVPFVLIDIRTDVVMDQEE